MILESIITDLGSHEEQNGRFFHIKMLYSQCRVIIKARPQVF